MKKYTCFKNGVEWEITPELRFVERASGKILQQRMWKITYGARDGFEWFDVETEREKHSFCIYEDCDQDPQMLNGKRDIYCEGHRKEVDE